MPVPQQPQQVDQRGRPLPTRSPVAPAPVQAPQSGSQPPVAPPVAQAPPPPGAPPASTSRTTVPPELPNPALHMGKNLSTKPTSRKEIMANQQDSIRETLREKIAARKTERQAENANKYARLQHVAVEEPREVGEALIEVAEALGAMAEGLSNLRDNLDLVEAPKTASIKVRLAAARKYAAAFKRTAEENPSVLADAVGEIYNSLDEVAAGLENLAENLGFEIPGGSPAMDAFTEEGENELEEAAEDGETIPEQIEEEVHDPDESEEVEEVTEKEASGSDNWVTDRDQKVETAQVPRLASKRGTIKK